MKVELRERCAGDMATIERLCQQDRVWHQHARGLGFQREGDQQVVAKSYSFMYLVDGIIVGALIARPRPETRPASVQIITWHAEEELPKEVRRYLHLLGHQRLGSEYGPECEFRGEMGKGHELLEYLTTVPGCAVHEASRDPVTHEVRTYQAFCRLGETMAMAFVGDELKRLVKELAG